MYNPHFTIQFMVHKNPDNTIKVGKTAIIDINGVGLPVPQTEEKEENNQGVKMSA